MILHAFEEMVPIAPFPPISGEGGGLLLWVWGDGQEGELEGIGRLLRPLAAILFTYGLQGNHTQLVCGGRTHTARAGSRILDSTFRRQRTSRCNFAPREVDYGLLKSQYPSLEFLGSSGWVAFRNPMEGGVFAPNLFEARTMDDELGQSHMTAEVEPADPAEPMAPEGALLLPYEESCKKVRELALRQLNRFILYEAKVLKGDDADAIHDMRVASRRLQQVLDLLYPKPRPSELRRMRRQIRRCRQVLGDVRNCDVLLEIVGRPLGRKRSARRAAWTAVQHFLLMRRSESFLRTIRKVGKINLTVLYVNLKEFLHHDRAHDHSAEHHVTGAATSRPGFAKDLTSALESTWSRFEDQVAQSHRNSRPEVIHGARIATKRLRYLLEVFHEFGVAGSADALVWLRQLQKHLGDWHDLEVLEQMMIEMLARPEFLRDQLPMAMEVEKLILRNRENKAGLEEKYFGMSRESPEMRRLKEWVSYLLGSPSTAFAKT